jgi:two-component system OmpR family sensor kinase
VLVIHSLRTRLLLTYVLITGLVLAIVGVSLFLFLVNNPVFNQLGYSRLENAAGNLDDVSKRVLSSPDIQKNQEVVNRFETRFNIRILIVDRDGEILVDSRPESGFDEDVKFMDFTEGELLRRGEFRDSSQARWLWVGRSLGEDRTLVLATPRPRTLSLFAEDILLPVVQAGAIGLIISILLAWLISRWVAAPLQRMSKAALAVASGDFRQSVALEGPREVQDVANSFNVMVQQVRTSQQVQRDFLANVSHELKTPLTSIQGFAQAMLDGAVADDDSRNRAAQVIYDESDRLRRLVEDLLDLARLDAGQIEFVRQPVNVEALLKSVVDKLVLPAGEKNVELVDRVSDLPTMVGDGDRLAQVFMNLVDNAIKHTPEGGKVVVRGDTASGWISIHVDDSGAGIPSEDLSRIFERFYQVDKARSGGKGRGVGLGLAISRQIVEAHGGRIVAQSSVGKGSRFTVQLPIIRPDDETLIHGSL